MRIGLSSPLAHESAEQWAARMKALGCGAVVFPVDHTAPESVIAAYADAAHREDLLIAEVGIWRNVLARDRAEREAARRYAAGQLRLADEIGARCCVNVSGTWGGPVWDGGYRENYTAECWEAIISYTRELIDEVRPTRTKYSLEPMPWMLPTSPDEYLDLIRDIDREAFGVHLDIINMINTPQRYFFPEVFLRECFDKLGTRILSCHLKDIRLTNDLTFQLKEVPCGEGTFPISEYIALADQADHNMPMIIEHLNTDREYLDSLAYVRSIIEQLG